MRHEHPLARRAYLTLNYLKEAVKRGECGYFADSWPPCSPDLNPCDFYLWPEMKRQLYQSGNHHFKTIPQLQDSLIKVANSLDRSVIKAACESFWKRIDWVQENKGALITKKSYM